MNEYQVLAHLLVGSWAAEWRRPLALSIDDLDALEQAALEVIRSVASDAAKQERERILQVVKNMSYDAAEMCARQNGDEYSAEAGFEQAQQMIYSVVLALSGD